jgi:protein phosphatase
MKTRGWATTDVGRRRTHNEDSLLCDDGLALYAVADGMGGHLGGERASRVAVEVLEHEMRLGFSGDVPSGEETQPGADPFRVGQPVLHRVTLALRRATTRACALIYDEAQGSPEHAGMGTTLTALMVHGAQASVCHVGDSRLYLYRDGRARQLTDDHSWIQEQIKAGVIGPEDALVSRFRNVITRSVGFEPEVEPDLLTLPIELGDCFLLCSDGLSNYLNEEEMGRALTSSFYRDAGPALVQIANDRGGDDNITCVLVYVGNT